MLSVKTFGMLLAVSALATSVAIWIMGGRFGAIEQQAYGSKRRPWWFIVAGSAIIALYVSSAISFAGAAEKSVAGWLLIGIIPVGFLLKATLLVFNKGGQQQVLAIKGDEQWRRIALLRLPVAIVLFILALLA